MPDPLASGAGLQHRDMPPLRVIRARGAEVAGVSLTRLYDG
ncbi:MAG: hypothetical protein OXG72_16395 [Acidobacteria bacterium]|nr:hypothetical protein [Acidobacteriota bacterium]